MLFWNKYFCWKNGHNFTRHDGNRFLNILSTREVEINNYNKIKLSFSLVKSIKMTRQKKTTCRPYKGYRLYRSRSITVLGLYSATVRHYLTDLELKRRISKLYFAIFAFAFALPKKKDFRSSREDWHPCLKMPCSMLTCCHVMSSHVTAIN